jgi:hypothetical protein
MSPSLVFVANEPRVYRETLSLALSALRPRAEVVAVDPDLLDAAVRRRKPDMVVCSRLSPAVEDSVPTWVLLYPEGDNMVVVGAGGAWSTTGSLDLDDLAAIVGPA